MLLTVFEYGWETWPLEKGEGPTVPDSESPPNAAAAAAADGGDTVIVHVLSVVYWVHNLETEIRC